MAFVDRPLKNENTESLIQLYNKNTRDKKLLKKLKYELFHRSSNDEIKLLGSVRTQLLHLNNNQHNDRKLFDYSAIQLREFFKINTNNPTNLRTLKYELFHRKAQGAIALLSEVKKHIMKFESAKREEKSQQRFSENNQQDNKSESQNKNPDISNSVRKALNELELSEFSSKIEIKKKINSLLIKFHPDTAGSTEFVSKFYRIQEINELMQKEGIIN